MTIHHNEVRNTKAHLTSDVCHNVGLEPILQPITSERLHHSTANTEDGGRVDIKATGLSKMIDNVHFLMLGCAHTYHSLPPSTCYRRHKQEKKGAYDQCFREVEHGCFLPLVLSASGGGPSQNGLQEVSVSGSHQA